MKSSISFLQDWLRNIRQNKSKHVSSFSSSSSISIPDSLKESGHVAKVGRQGVERQLAGKEENRLVREMFGANKTTTINSMDIGMEAGGPIKRGRGRPRKHPKPQFPSDASRKSSSIGARRFHVPKTFVPSGSLEFPANSGLQKCKTNPNILNSVTRRRFLKTNENKSQSYRPTFAPRGNANEPYRESLAAEHSKLSSNDLISKSENSSNWSRGVTSPVPFKRRGPGRPRKSPLIEVQRWPTAGRHDPKEGKRTETESRAPYYNYHGDNFDRNISSYQPKNIIVTRRSSGSDNDDVIITGYSPPRKQESYGVPSDVEWRSGDGQTEKTRRKRSTQLELLRSATDEFSRTTKTQKRPHVYSEEKMTPSVKDREFCLAPTVSLSKIEDGRGRERTISFKYDSEDEDAIKGASASDISAENQPAVHRSPVYSRTESFGRRNTGTSDHKWLTSTPVRHRNNSVPRRSYLAANRKKRSDKNDDRAWNRCTHNDRSPWSRRKLTKRPANTSKQFHGRRNFPLPATDNDAPCFYPEPAATTVTQSLSGISEEATVSGEPVTALMELQQKLAALSDPVMLRRVVEIVEDSGKYRLDDAMFDFDLCNLDRNTVTRLYDCLQISSPVL